MYDRVDRSYSSLSSFESHELVWRITRRHGAPFDDRSLICVTYEVVIDCWKPLHFYLFDKQRYFWSILCHLSTLLWSNAFVYSWLHSKNRLDHFFNRAITKNGAFYVSTSYDSVTLTPLSQVCTVIVAQRCVRQRTLVQTSPFFCSQKNNHQTTIHIGPPVRIIQNVLIIYLYYIRLFYCHYYTIYVICVCRCQVML